MGTIIKRSFKRKILSVVIGDVKEKVIKKMPNIPELLNNPKNILETSLNPSAFYM